MVSAHFPRRNGAPRGRRVAAFAAVVALIGASATAHAQTIAGDRSAAAEAYDNGTRRFLQHDYAGAANWFETANRMAPSALALSNAVRAHHQAGGIEHLVRAATLALRLRQQYGTDAPAQRLAQRVIEQVGPQALRVAIQCAACEVESDGVMQPGTEFFTTPGPHALVGHWSGGRTLRSQVDGAAGQVQTVALAESAATGPVVATSSAPSVTPPVSASSAPPAVVTVRTPPPPVTPHRGGLHPGVFVGGLVATAALGGVAIWSWLDATNQGSALITYAQTNGAANPTMEASVQSAETRTIALDVATGVVGAATVAFLIFTRWSNEERPAPRVVVSALPGIGGLTGLTVGGSF